MKTATKMRRNGEAVETKERTRTRTKARPKEGTMVVVRPLAKTRTLDSLKLRARKLSESRRRLPSKSRCKS